MKALGAVAIAAAWVFATAALADTGALRGTWKGPWYIGMSSGMATVEIAGDGSGTIALTNLDEFGQAPAPLAKQAFDGQHFVFSATASTGTVLTMDLQLGNGGKQLRGNGKHNGFGARMELQRAD
jgi:hypothetical protein